MYVFPVAIWAFVLYVHKKKKDEQSQESELIEYYKKSRGVYFVSELCIDAESNVETISADIKQNIEDLPQPQPSVSAQQQQPLQYNQEDETDDEDEEDDDDGMPEHTPHVALARASRARHRPG